MTTDELVILLEGITGCLDLDDVRKGADWLPSFVSDLEMDDWLLLVRFLAGERPSGTEQPPAPIRRSSDEIEGYNEDPVAGPHFTKSMGNSLGEIRLL